MCLLLPLLIRLCRNNDKNVSLNAKQSQYPHPVNVPMSHKPARSNLAIGRKLERKYQEDLARFGPDVAEDLHRQRLSRARRYVTAENVSRTIKLTVCAEPPLVLLPHLVLVEYSV